MALSGTIGTGNYSNQYQYYITWSATQNIENNTSTITIKWIYKKIASDPYGSYNVSGSSKVNLNIGGVWSGASRADFDLRSASVGSTSTLKSYTRTVTHNADGTLSLTIGGTHATDVSWGTKSASGTITLNTIPRASSPTATGSFTLGGSITINTNRVSSSFTHTLRYGWGGMSGNIATGLATNTTWTIPKSLANGIPNGTSGTLRIYCDTYNGSTLIGTKYVDKTVTMPNTTEFQPSITGCTLTEAVSGLNTQFNAFVQSKSKISGRVSASGAYGSTIKNYSISINGVTYTTSEFTTELLISSGSQNCSVTVTDSRGRSKNAIYTYNVIEYENPTIPILTVERCDSDGTLNDEGANAKITINAIISPVNNKNSKAFNLLYKKQSDTSYNTITLSSTNYSLNATQIISNIDVDYEYTFRLEATDYFTTTTKEMPLSTAFTLINFNSSGKGIAFGRVSSLNAMQINMDIYDKFNLRIRNGLAAYDSGGEEDPNTSLEELMLTNHTNGPGGSSRTLYYIRQIFYSSKTTTSNRTQIAYPYSTGVIHERHYINGTWSSWVKYATL